MATWIDFCKTDQGKSLDAKITAGDTPLKITKAMSAAGRVNPTQLHTLTELPQPKQQLLMGKVKINGDTQEVMLPIRLSNEGLTQGYIMHLLGIFAQDPEKGEILYMVSQTSASAGEEIPAEVTQPAFSIQWNHVIKTADASNITVEVSQAGLQTIEEAEATYAKKTEVLQLKEWVKVPTNLGNGTVAKFDIVPVENGGTGGKTVLEAKNNLGLGNVDNTRDLDKPVSTAMQTALNGKQNNLGFTPLQQGGGTGQLTNKVHIGWSGSKLKAQVDNVDQGNIAFESWVNGQLGGKSDTDHAHGRLYNNIGPGQSVGLFKSGDNYYFYPDDVNIKTYLGGNSHPFRSCYLEVAPVVSSDINLKMDIEKIVDDKRYIDLFDEIEPYSFKLKSGDRIHTGFIANTWKMHLKRLG